jgi:phage nucleotide-binding protein
MIKISKPSEITEGFHGILYGKPKVGKTSTADDPKFKTLLIDMEGGSAVLSQAKNVDRIQVEDFKDFIEITDSVKRGYFQIGNDKVKCDYDLYVIDSISALQELIKNYIAVSYAPSRRREITAKFGAMADWGDLRDLITRSTKAWHQLTKRGEDSVHVMWIAHEQVIKDETTDQASGTKIQLQGKDTADVVMAHVDGIFYMFNKQNKDTKELERGILTQPAGIYAAGVRQSKHAKPLEPQIINPVWSDIFTKLGYVRK